MVSTIHLGDRLHHLREKLLRALSSQGATGRRRNAVREWKRNRVVRMRSIHRSGVGRTRGIHHVVVRVQGKRNIVGNPEYSVAASHNSLRRHAVGKSDAGRQIVFRKRKSVLSSWGHQKCIAHHARRIRRKKLVQIIWSFGIEVSQPAETLRPWTLQFVPKPKIQGELIHYVPSVTEIERAIGLLTGGKGGNHGLCKEVILEIAEVVG